MKPNLQYPTDAVFIVGTIPIRKDADADPVKCDHRENGVERAHAAAMLAKRKLRGLVDPTPRAATSSALTFVLFNSNLQVAPAVKVSVR